MVINPALLVGKLCPDDAERRILDFSSGNFEITSPSGPVTDALRRLGSGADLTDTDIVKITSILPPGGYTLMLLSFEVANIDEVWVEVFDENDQSLKEYHVRVVMLPVESSTTVACTLRRASANQHCYRRRLALLT